MDTLTPTRPTRCTLLLLSYLAQLWISLFLVSFCVYMFARSGPHGENDEVFVGIVMLIIGWWLPASKFERQ